MSIFGVAARQSPYDGAIAADFSREKAENSMCLSYTGSWFGYCLSIYRVDNINDNSD